MADFKIDPDYNEVKDRIAEFRAKHPDGTLQSEVVRWPSADFPFVAVQAWAYRTPDDPMPGIGLAWENVPGKTPYTKDSELMNAETSAWGRALIAVGAASAKKSVASANEVRRTQNAPQAEQKPPSGSAAGSSSDAHVSEEGGGTGAEGEAAPRPAATTHEHTWQPLLTRPGYELCDGCRVARKAP